ncbi:MAG: pyridoxal phosphate-dependent aminotransferase [Myxococcota bacterium]
MSTRLSRRGIELPASPIRRLVPYADAAKERGIHVHPLNIGQPDVPTPAGMIAAYQSYDEKVLAYGPSTGLPELREKVAASYRAQGFGLEAEHVQVTFGGSEAVQFALAALCDPGDQVLVSEPFYANYAGFAVASGVEVVPVPASARDGFALPGDEFFEARIGPRTRAVIICSPGNPTGTVYDWTSLERLARLVERRDLALISDEVYRDFVYDGGRAHSALELSIADERVVVVDSVSKRFSACGARVGFAISRVPELVQAFTRLCFSRLCPATVDQVAAVAAYDTPPSYFDEVRAEYQRRRDVLVEGLNAIEGVRTHLPQGAFYTMARFPVEDIDDFCRWLLEVHDHEGESVMMAPGTGFYGTPGLGKDEARLAYVLEVPALRRSIRILEEGLKRYPGRLD